MSNKAIGLRIPMELKSLNESTVGHGISCETHPISSENYACLAAIIPGPKESFYEGALFKINVFLGDNYPTNPPLFKSVSQIYHPNFDYFGNICLDILTIPPKGNYHPEMTLETLLLSIQLLLANPNPDDPLNGAAAELLKQNPEEFKAKVRQELIKNSLIPSNSDEAQL